jgi:hypothetical protein
LRQPHEHHFNAGIADTERPDDGHDARDRGRKQRRTSVCGGQSIATRDPIGGGDDDMVVVAGEKSLTKNRGEQTQRTAEQQHAPQVAIYVAFPDGSLPALITA